VGSFESEDEKKKNKAFQACVARICKRVINKRSHWILDPSKAN